MPYRVLHDIAESRLQLEQLVKAFDSHYRTYANTNYNEAQLRIDFINPLLKTFGWDIDNELSQTQFLRDVIQEEAIDVTEGETNAKKNPDYTLRVDGTRKIFVEAKKVAVDIERSKESAFQARRYGWSANHDHTYFRSLIFGQKFGGI
jgi:predicted type IV restriction endonuclease